MRNQADRLNNIEQVVIDTAQPGVYTITVTGYDVADGPQVYSLIGSGELGGVGVNVQDPPSLVPSGDPVAITASVTVINDEIVPGTIDLHYRLDGGAYTTVDMVDLGGDLYGADIPAPECDTTPEYYITVEGVSAGLVSDPSDAPASVYSFQVGIESQTAFDNMEYESGWTVGAPDDDATTGIWNRSNPEGTGAQPEDDHTIGGSICWVTDSRAGSGLGDWDIDGGKTTLYSPNYDLSDTQDPTISYWRWYSNVAGASPNADVFTIDISTDGGSNWTNVEIVGPAGPGTSGGWFYYEFHVLDLGVSLTDQVKLRFVAADEGDGSLVEAAIDDLTIIDFSCDDPADPCPWDVAGADSDVNLDDLLALLANWGPCPVGECPWDVAGTSGPDGDVNLDDLLALLANWGPCP